MEDRIRGGAADEYRLPAAAGEHRSLGNTERLDVLHTTAADHGADGAAEVELQPAAPDDGVDRGGARADILTAGRRKDRVARSRAGGNVLGAVIEDIGATVDAKQDGFGAAVQEGCRGAAELG